MNLFYDLIREEPEYSQFCDALKKEFSKDPMPILTTGLCEGATLAFLGALFEDAKTYGGGIPLLLCPDEKECRTLCDFFAGQGLHPFHYPARDLTFYHMTASHEYEQERLSVLSALLDGTPDLLLATPDAALSFTIPKEKLAASRVKLSSDEEVDLAKLVEALLAAGFSRSELAESPGQFAVRGGILDLFPPRGTYLDDDGKTFSGTYPLRLEFFGDEIDRMGVFDPDTQRLTRQVKEVSFCPAREVLPDAAALDRVLAAVQSQLKKATDENAKEELRRESALLAAAKNGDGDLQFLDKYLSLVYPEKTCLLDYLDERRLVVLFGTANLREKAAAREAYQKTIVKELCDGGTVAKKYAIYAKSAADLEAYYGRMATVCLDAVARSPGQRQLAGIFTFRTRQTVSYAENENLFLEDLHGYVQSGYYCIVETESEAAAKETRALLQDADFVLDDGKTPIRNRIPGKVLVISGSMLPGFELHLPKIVLLSRAQTEGMGYKTERQKAPRFKHRKNAVSLLSYTDLEVGDYVVHEDFGIGLYTGIETLTSDGVKKDYVAIRYAGAGKLYLPIEQLDKVSKYIGAKAEDGTVKLSSLGGTAWKNTKAKAKAAVEGLAKDLIKLYAARKRLPGFAFPPDDSNQQAFEEAFEYDETESQIQAANEIKHDMMQPTPMDRLLCGDVGYGKTEVALRAAYKAVLGGKQVAILVPTTLLALQHYQTLQSRMRNFAVNVDMLSRFRTPKQQATTLRRLAKGEIDIVVGTHRLLSQDISFRDLGLLIVDEEQRFGVAQKEKLKQLSVGTDVLSLSATPIPRTLNMALGGIRDISILDEAPGDRQPVQTYVLEEDPLIIEEAIRRELRRGGQVFYLHNSIDTIYSLGKRLSERLPDARVVVAHGQMEKDDLEAIWAEMLSGKIDVLVCTTIIETGVDVPNANTLIVSNAHRLGLSQLHQIRGRIGRSPRRAYAYFTVPENLALSDIAAKRLAAIREYAEFGAGFKIALRDLEIRGAGNLLGAEQHGHLDAVGYDLYIKLLNRAVLEEKGELPAPERDCTVSLTCDAYLPERYIPYFPQRMAIYKRIALVSSEEELLDLTDELLDRFGEMPNATKNLLRVGLVHSLALQCGLTSVRQEGSVVFLSLDRIDPNHFASLAKSYALERTPSLKPVLRLKIKPKEQVLTVLSSLLADFSSLQSK